MKKLRKPVREILEELYKKGIYTYKQHAASAFDLGKNEVDQALAQIQAHYLSLAPDEEELEKICNDVHGVSYLEDTKDESFSPQDKVLANVLRNNNNILAKAISEAYKRKIKGE